MAWRLIHWFTLIECISTHRPALFYFSQEASSETLDALPLPYVALVNHRPSVVVCRAVVLPHRNVRLATAAMISPSSRLLGLQYTLYTIHYTLYTIYTTVAPCLT